MGDTVSGALDDARRLGFVGRAAELNVGARHDPELTRAHAVIAALLATPAEVFADAALREAALPWVGRPWLAPGPDRAELLGVAGASRSR